MTPKAGTIFGVAADGWSMGLWRPSGRGSLSLDLCLRLLTVVTAFWGNVVSIALSGSPDAHPAQSCCTTRLLIQRGPPFCVVFDGTSTLGASFFGGLPPGTFLSRLHVLPLGNDAYAAKYASTRRKYCPLHIASKGSGNDSGVRYGGMAGGADCNHNSKVEYIHPNIGRLQRLQSCQYIYIYTSKSL